MKKIKFIGINSLLLACSMAFCAISFAEEDSGDTEKSFAKSIEGTERIEGLLDVYQHQENGKVFLAVKPEQLGQEFIYTAITTDGVVEGGHFRGAFLENRIVSIRRHFERLEFVSENTAFYFDPDNAVSKASEANISSAILATQDIIAEDEATGTLLIAMDDVLLGENLLQVKPTANPEQKPGDAFSLGELSKTKSKVTEIKSYPDNTDWMVEYVYENPSPAAQGEAEITDSRYVSIGIQHSFIRVPDNSYQPRFDDSRIGYFTDTITDLTSMSHTPYRDAIHRWHLEKSNPAAALSDPVEPIVFWIENTTPEEYRNLIRNAALAWNQSFEKAGLSNAVQVKVQPDDAEWDAGDIRYNVLRWTSSPNPPFGGYGPSFVNPRTGQIIGADIMLEYSFLTNRVRLEKVLRGLAFEQPISQVGGQDFFCSLGHNLQMSNLFATQALQGVSAGSELREQMISDSMHYLILHEIGHTLGLNHNMKASQMLDSEQLFDTELVEARGLAGSVMDYPAVNIAPPGKSNTRFYNVRPGPYDDWAIEFGYSTALADLAQEANRLDVIAQRSTQPGLEFGNDADDMRSPGKGIDPRVNIGDLSSDPIAYAADRLDLIDQVMSKLIENSVTEGESYQELHDAYLSLLVQFSGSANTLSRYIGGVYVNRAMAGQAGEQVPFVPVDLDDQKRAMSVLSERVFSPGAFSATEQLYSHLRQQRRGFDFFVVTEDPKVHEWTLGAQKGVLDHVLHPVVLKRMTDSRLYGNEYNVATMMGDLTDAVFAADLSKQVNTFRQNLQLEYVNRLIAMTTGESKAGYDYPTQSAALYHLQRIEKMVRNSRSRNIETSAHRNNIAHIIKQALEPGSHS